MMMFSIEGLDQLGNNIVSKSMYTVSLCNVSFSCKINLIKPHVKITRFWLFFLGGGGTTRNSLRQEKYIFFKMMNIFNTNTRSQLFDKLGFSIIIINLVLLSSNSLIIYICRKLLSEVMNGYRNTICFRGEGVGVGKYCE
jgi:hypothetical protein